MEDEILDSIYREIEEMQAADEKIDCEYWSGRVIEKFNLLKSFITSLPEALKLDESDKGYPLSEAKGVYLNDVGFVIREITLALSEDGALHVYGDLGEVVDVPVSSVAKELLEVVDLFYKEMKVKLDLLQKKNLEILKSF